MADYLRLAKESAEKERTYSSSPVSRHSKRDISDISDISPADASSVAPAVDVTERLATLSASSGSAQKALTDVLSSEARLRVRFETVCMESAAALRGEVLTFSDALKQHGHVFGDYRCEHEETANALYELAGELLPGSPAAALIRLRKRIKGRGHPKTARERVEELAASEYDFYDEFVLLSGRPPCQERLLTVAQRIWRELQERDQRQEPRGFTDHVWEVVRSLFPDSPGAAWDSGWAAGVRSEVRKELAERAREAGLDSASMNMSGLDAAFEDMWKFEEAGARCGFRLAASRAVCEVRRAVRALQPDCADHMVVPATSSRQDDVSERRATPDDAGKERGGEHRVEHKLF